MTDYIVEMDASDVSLKSFEVKDELNPRFWVDDRLNSRVRIRLLDIADDFIDELAVNWVKPKDIILTGSIANYNWSKYSDVDVHIVMDYGKVYPKKKKFVEDYFNSKKEMWKQTHEDLKIYGFPVEMYVQDVDGDEEMSGVYSLNRNEWVKKPKNLDDGDIDEKYVKKVSAKIITDIDEISEKSKKEDDLARLRKLGKRMKRVYDRLKDLRSRGLKSKAAEMSNGNIIYKVVRRSGHLDMIWETINDIYNKVNSLK